MNRRKIPCLWIGVIVSVSAACSAVPDEPAAQPVAPTGSYDSSLPLKSHLRSGRQYYPPAARRSGRVGRVALEYSVDARGKAQNISVRFSDHDDFAASAKAMLSEVRFEVPPDWASSDGPLRPFHIGFIFQLEGRPKPPPLENYASPVVITAVPFR